MTDPVVHGFAAVTLTHIGEWRFPALWAYHHARMGADPVLVLLHVPEPDDAAVAAWRRDFRSQWGGMPRRYGTGPVGPPPAVLELRRAPAFDHAWMRSVAMDACQLLLRGAAWVLFAECDEFLLAPPDRFHAGPRPLARLLDALDPEVAAVRAAGFEVVHDRLREPPLNWMEPLLPQRHWWYPCRQYSKTLLARRPLRWSLGFHETDPPGQGATDTGVVLAHLRKVDFDAACRRLAVHAALPWSAADVAAGFGCQNRLTAPEDVADHFDRHADTGAPVGPALSPIPAGFRAQL